MMEVEYNRTYPHVGQVTGITSTPEVISTIFPRVMGIITGAPACQRGLLPQLGQIGRVFVLSQWVSLVA